MGNSKAQGIPTEDTPTRQNRKVPDSIKGTGFYMPMDLVPEEHRHIFNINLGDPCACGSDNCYACVCGEEKHD